MDSLPVLLKLPRRGDTPRILTMTEPGILAKVGFNDQGVGVCLNFLAGPPPAAVPTGLPVHCLLRLALSCGTLRGSEELLKASPRHCACHILLADALGQFRMLEFFGTSLECAAADPLAHNHGAGAEEAPIEGAEWQILPPTVVAHTNHYLHPGFAASSKDLAHTRERLQRVGEIVDEFEAAEEDRGAVGSEQQLGLAKRILGDRHGYPRSILFDKADGMSAQGTIATVCTVLMELRSLRMHVTHGSAMAQQFFQVTLLESSL